MEDIIHASLRRRSRRNVHRPSEKHITNNRKSMNCITPNVLLSHVVSKQLATRQAALAASFARRARM